MKLDDKRINNPNLRGTLQEALDSAKEALRDYYDNPQADTTKGTGEGKTIIGAPFDEESTKGNGKDIIDPYWIDDDKRNEPAHQSVLEDYMTIVAKEDIKAMRLAKLHKLEGNGKDIYSIETVSIGEERVDIVEYTPDDLDALCNTCNSEDCTNCGFAKEYHKAIIEPFDDSNDSYIKTLNKIG